ncbi:hypothetical protein ACHAL6_00255 [Proteiniclasticum sp. C24MP]|uniref:hypothetical protein n=1 Tax=Proteiniclasticum sp. C24MP TaxID=3374101 RepID=UPI0037546668
MKKIAVLFLTLLVTAQVTAYGYTIVTHGIRDTSYGYVNANDDSERAYTVFVLENMNAGGVVQWEAAVTAAGLQKVLLEHLILEIIQCPQ